MSDDMPYRYFISYSHNRGFGSAEYRRNVPIRTYDDVRSIAQTIENSDSYITGLEPRPQDLVILNWILLSGHDDAPSATEVEEPQGDACVRCERPFICADRSMEESSLCKRCVVDTPQSPQHNASSDIEGPKSLRDAVALRIAKRYNVNATRGNNGDYEAVDDILDTFATWLTSRALRQTVLADPAVDDSVHDYGTHFVDEVLQAIAERVKADA